MKLLGELEPNSLKTPQKGITISNKLDKRKRYGNIKGITCAYGRPQRCYITKEESSSPTISLEAIFTSLNIDAHKWREIAFFDVPGAHLNADIPEGKFVILKLKVNL